MSTNERANKPVSVHYRNDKQRSVYFEIVSLVTIFSRFFKYHCTSTGHVLSLVSGCFGPQDKLTVLHRAPVCNKNRQSNLSL